MGAIAGLDPGRVSGRESCLARSVVDALSDEPTLEAVTINRARQTISLATLGQANVPRLTERISGTIQRSQQVSEERHCNLLAGDGDCLTCPQPLSERERQHITVRQ